MSLTSVFKPEGSIIAGIATGALVWGIYAKDLPDTATVHATDPGDVNIDLARKKATRTAAAAVAAVSLLSRDVNVFVLGASFLFILDFNARHANASNPQTGELVTQGYGYGPGLRSVNAPAAAA